MDEKKKEEDHVLWDASLLQDLLPIYYKKLFPFTQYYKWLRYKDSGASYFRNREFSFTLKDDIYLRYRSYADQAELEKDIRSKCPHKIDIGAVYTCSPKMRDMVRAGEFVAQYKELVFDIDMTDYDDVRKCCSGADICLRCWPLMTVAIKIINRALKEDFGFRHLLWIYSGRRGVHCWVSDEKARRLSAVARSAVAEYLSVVKGGANMKKKVTLRYANIHASVSKAVNIIAEYFDDYIIKQDLLSSEQDYDTFKGLITDEKVLPLLKQAEDKELIGDTTSLRWEGIKQIFKKSLSEEGAVIMDKTPLSALSNNMKEIMLQYMYPRLDINVSKGVNHLLKSPFCIHPKTGRVCVPINVDSVDQFNPFQVPTLHDLTEDLANWKGEGHIHSYKKTRLAPYIDSFDIFLQQLTVTESQVDCKNSSALDIKTQIAVQ